MGGGRWNGNGDCRNDYNDYDYVYGARLVISIKVTPSIIIITRVKCTHLRTEHTSQQTHPINILPHNHNGGLNLWPTDALLTLRQTMYSSTSHPSQHPSDLQPLL